MRTSKIIPRHNAYTVVYYYGKPIPCLFRKGTFYEVEYCDYKRVDRCKEVLFCETGEVYELADVKCWSIYSYNEFRAWFAASRAIGVIKSLFPQQIFKLI